jgi:hypothetical protein
MESDEFRMVGTHFYHVYGLLILLELNVRKKLMYCQLGGAGMVLSAWWRRNG